ncbi:MAG TPA: hypothetical protein EYO72_02585 [Marine Group III euryarchaeote]|nr:hypothetical protein [Marine Group III euryarchaeote]
MDTPMARRNAENALDARIRVQEMMDESNKDAWKQFLYMILAAIACLGGMVLIVVANGDW